MSFRGKTYLFIGVLLLLVGIGFIFSPYIDYHYNKLSSRNVIEEEKLTVTNNIDEEIENEKEIIPDKLIEDKGVLEIPSLELSEKIYYGVEQSDLDRGLCFYPQSGYPDNGNVSIAGHRNQSFLNLHQLNTGDSIKLYYRERKYVYSVENVFVTHNRDWSVIDPTPKPAITLTTCDPLIRPPGGRNDRLIVRAYLTETKRPVK
ncbi:hypothetical protein SYNTR_1688 [Candidatus Syntrophocurvum alkaliphilum]|uniref:Sortase A, LPXTG specific n=1 Tax=Candidatus Syntrophocurvum alkaliphilum TaxID=2293317 RepID=A0A6I6DDS9_9FIRM|nr:class E sortase [Candidatus Syntrophocurvum alkaliphilum]QGU00282.1 hypothetical protein SYNTR_1688 [Candidatus Syntrophocurvum alkaliphilum]